LNFFATVAKKHRNYCKTTPELHQKNTGFTCKLSFFQHFQTKLGVEQKHHRGSPEATKIQISTQMPLKRKNHAPTSILSLPKQKRSNSAPCAGLVKN
jgi:hypothetical protein